MKPSSFSWPERANSTASQRNVASVSPCLAMSSIVRTFVISSTPSPAKAMLVTLSLSESAKIQPATISTNAAAVIFSSRVRGPIAANAVRAAAGASGVAPTPGGNSRATTSGSRTMAVSAGTDAATSHLPKPMSRPKSRATCRPIGFADVAVIHSAEETARLAIPQNIR